ncbi:hypothetical protein B296_00029968 [Ensete ventricosum]|uniref:Uncharacterized protein n=1 Tax=Ensete ventricosum TaxID=4639 RepID=A0A426Y125_ENSVE|nr:hypothetical protein B296_00029968 [Ensete ventricosum]
MSEVLGSGVLVDRGPCTLARPRSSQCRGGAWSDGKSPRVRLGRLAAGVVELRGAGAFIAMVTGYPYLKLLSSLLLTIPLHLTTPSVVLSARRAPLAGGCRPCPPYLPSTLSARLGGALRLGLSPAMTFNTEYTAKASMDARPRCLSRERVLLTLTHPRSNCRTFYTEVILTLTHPRTTLGPFTPECMARESAEAQLKCSPRHLTPGIRVFSCHLWVLPIYRCSGGWAMPPFASGSNCLPDILADFFVPTSIELLALPKDFLKACNNTRVVSSCELFRLCFCLSRGSSSYYISPNTRFKIKGASSRGKGWQSCFFIVDESED